VQPLVQPLAPPQQQLEQPPTAPRGPPGCAGGCRRGMVRIASLAQSFPLLVCLAVLGIAVPFAIELAGIGYVEGILAFMPQDSLATQSFISMQSTFGVSTIFPNTLLILPPSAGSLTDEAWLEQSYATMNCLAARVNATLEADDVDYRMQLGDFSGAMIMNGLSTAALISSLAQLNLTQIFADWYIDRFSNEAQTATKVHVSLQLDPFAHEGQRWIVAMRGAMETCRADSRAAGVDIGEMYLSGTAPEQMDAASATFAMLPKMTAVILSIVCLVVAFSFRSVLLPLRAVLCLLWMLVVTFGAAVYVYQGNVLAFLGWGPLMMRGGDALYWMSPSIAFAMVVGLGLDYDVFFMESVVELYDEGYSPKESVLLALEQTGGIVSAAGVIMVFAFGALVIGSTPGLNQIGFALCLSVLIDCFVTTKVIIPCFMALIPGRANFWPRVVPQLHASGTAMPVPG